jgi:DNA-binding HxlR family transcriptional regulator
MGTHSKAEKEALVHEILGRIADKWTLLILDTLEEHGVVRFTELRRHVGRISQKMLTKTLRQMERDGLVTRRVHPVIPPHVDYELTRLGETLGEAVCSVWKWVDRHRHDVEKARRAFDGRSA